MERSESPPESSGMVWGLVCGLHFLRQGLNLWHLLTSCCNRRVLWLPSDLDIEKREGGNDPEFGNSWPGTTENFALVKATKSAIPSYETIHSFSRAGPQTPKVWLLQVSCSSLPVTMLHISTACLPKIWTSCHKQNKIVCSEPMFHMYHTKLLSYLP